MDQPTHDLEAVNSPTEYHRRPQIQRISARYFEDKHPAQQSSMYKTVIDILFHHPGAVPLVTSKGLPFAFVDKVIDGVHNMKNPKSYW